MNATLLLPGACAEASGFRPLPEYGPDDLPAARRSKAPAVLRGAMAQCEAVRNWSFASLAALVPDQDVTVVEGNREIGQTRFGTARLRGYLQSLADGRQPGYLKEFDLLALEPGLARELDYGRLLPARHLHAIRSWIGPAGARTGLHYDYLDNVAVQVIGRKRWYLARPGAVERRGAVSRRYDAWATLAACPAEALAVRGDASGDFFSVDLHPGDLLYVPQGWWHEVVNLEASLFVGGFHGARLPVLSKWVWIGAREQMHRWGWIGREGCTCHPAR